MRVLLCVDRGNGAAKAACGDGWCNLRNRPVCLQAVGVKLDIQLLSLFVLHPIQTSRGSIEVCLWTAIQDLPPHMILFHASIHLYTRLFRRPSLPIMPSKAGSKEDPMR